MLKLNLGCGGKIYDGWVNVDKYDHYPIDILHDLETFPYPFDDDSCNEILLSHVLEHLGRDTEVFNNIVKELFRVCCHDALIHIIVPHPRHDNFLSDPTHVRPINEHVIALYDKKRNLEWEAIGAANTPLGLLLDVDLRIEEATLNVENKYRKLLADNEITEDQLIEMIAERNNICSEIKLVVRVNKVADDDVQFDDV
jgi:hypothetical protein